MKNVKTLGDYKLTLLAAIAVVGMGFAPMVDAIASAPNSCTTTNTKKNGNVVVKITGVFDDELACACDSATGLCELQDATVKACRVERDANGNWTVICIGEPN